MLICSVIGNVWATRKEDGLTGLKFLVVQPVQLEPDNPIQPAFIAVDRIGAGLGDRVIVTKGAPASYIEEKGVPVDALIIGIIDVIGRGENGD
ncbi:EutN/CcmL family microcompartment protein [Alkalihalobacterium elongatum]|uniref:EutN/CcmL family microcompartment protein n=1 Tax=Alkalihalobacterium elongatum TaxID=2675466 RepID=UPI001C1FBE0F|nr:EutN/CcmL family microcompartment protein [Alkalihalobacterium elongatum]